MFPDGPTLVVFAIAAFVLLITPGPAVFYIVARSIDQGRIAGIVSTLGVGAGALVQVGAAALGVSAVLLSSALAFDILKYLGAAYLIYLGVRKFLVRDELEQSRVLAPRTLARIFYDGVVVNVLNPKTALFFFAFLPQFVDISSGAVAAQIIFLGVLFVAMGIVSDGSYAVVAGTFGNWFKQNHRVLRAQRYLAGSVFIGLGLAAALSGSHKK
jgi:threonine/homoserine/homoserine lactone efflux protein